MFLGEALTSGFSSAGELARAMNFLLESAMEKRARNEKRTDEARDILRERTLKAKRTAEENMEEIKEKVGLFRTQNPARLLTEKPSILYSA